METLPDGRTALKAGGRQQFVKDMSDFAIGEGMGPLDPADSGTIKDITSEGRLNLIFNTMTQSANDYSYWKQGMDPDVLDAFPAQRFIREADVITPRPVHQANEGVVMLKSDLDFWMAMNDPSFGGFGVPWGPWGFNSEMGVQDEDRATAEQLGLLDPGEKVEPVEKDFNERLEASTRGLDDDMVAKLKESFGDQVTFEGDAVKWNTDAPAEERAEVPAKEEPLAPAASTTLDDVLTNLGLDGNAPATASDMRDLREQLKEAKPVDAAKFVKYIKGAQPSGALTDAGISNTLQEFMDFVPQSALQRLPKLEIKVVNNKSFLGQYSPCGGIELNQAMLQNDPQRARQTLFHELMHWLHREGPQAYRDAIAEHFAKRTDGERVKRLAGYSASVRGKSDDFYDPYAGRIYDFEIEPGGLEIPTRYIEWLTMDPDAMAEMWNNPSFRETMKIVLAGLF